MNEMEIKKKSSDIQNFSENAVVQNRSDLEDALEMLKTIKKHKTMITDYWKEAKKSAKKTYQNIVSKERQMLDICEIIDNTLVPTFFKGIELREVNTKKILEIKHENPEIDIPGIKFYKEKSVAIRF